MDLLFWVTEFAPDLKCASLTDGSNLTAMRIREITKPGNFLWHANFPSVFIFLYLSLAGLAVDWINDKVYWDDDDDELKGIFVYDLKTKKTTKVIGFEESSPSKLKFFPQANNSGWVHLISSQENFFMKLFFPLSTITVCCTWEILHDVAFTR